MPTFDTKNFGEIEYAEDSVLEFPVGLPAFEQEHRFVMIQQPATEPVIFLQSLADPGLSFVTVPVTLVDPSFSLDAPADELEAIGAVSQPVVLAIVTIPRDGHITANLMAPILVNPVTRRAMQYIQSGTRYSCQHPLEDAC